MYEWANNYPEVQKICKLFNLVEVDNPIKFHYTPLPCFLQDGPQCGLVALAICSQQVSKEIVQELMDYAQNKGFTNNGEMFSAVNLQEVAQFYLKNNDVVLNEGCLDQSLVKEHLLTGGLMLVPYDTDRDFRPCLQNGHKAHWAAISGAIETDENFFVIARHGKARNIAFWRLKDLSQSNAQLNEFSPDRKYSNLTYILPENGLNGPQGISSFSILISEKCTSNKI